jgi:protein ImuA
MQAAAEKLGFLKESLVRAGLERPDSHGRVALGHVAADACLKGGIGRGTLHEFFPGAAGDEAAATGLAAALAARVAVRKRVLWLTEDFAGLEHGEISALGLLELGLGPARFLLLRATDAVSVLRAAADALTCRALGALVIEIPGEVKALDLAASRRLVLAANESGVTAFLLRCSAEPEPSAAETRWLVRAARSDCKNENWGHPLFDAELVRNRHGPTGQWLMEWNSDDGLFRPADPGAVVSAPCDRPSAASFTYGTNFARVA